MIELYHTDFRGIHHEAEDGKLSIFSEFLLRAGSKNPVILLNNVERIDERVLISLLDVYKYGSVVDNYLGVKLNISNILLILSTTDNEFPTDSGFNGINVLSLKGMSDLTKLKIAREVIITKVSF